MSHHPLAALLALSLTASLAACGAPSQPAASASGDPGGAGEGDPAARAAFAAVLTALLETHALPGVRQLDAPLYGPLSENQFAVYDVDGDGAEELILHYTTASMAGKIGCVYAYDAPSDALRLVLDAYPPLIFYGTGAVRSDWSHNPPLAGTLWSHGLYRYDPDTDGYALAGSVDTWDRSARETWYDGRPFPEDVDVSGTGSVYYLAEGGADPSASPPVDVAEYEAWRDKLLGDGAELELPYRALTPENVAQLEPGASPQK